MKDNSFDSQEMQDFAAENLAESQVHAPADTAQDTTPAPALPQEEEARAVQTPVKDTLSDRLRGELELLLEVNPEGIPAGLREFNTWVLAGVKIEADGRLSKPPFYVKRSGKYSILLPARITNRADMKPFEAIIADIKNWRGEIANVVPKKENRERYTAIIAGIGLVLQREYELIGIDLDHCLSGSGELQKPELKELVDKMLDLGFYVERSISGTGLHAFAHGIALPGISDASVRGNGIELYTNKRYLTFTGQAYDASRADPSPLVRIETSPEAEEILLALIEMTAAKKTQGEAAPQGTQIQMPTEKRGRGRPKKFKVTPETINRLRSDDAFLLSRIPESENAEVFNRLFFGGHGHGEDESRNDMTLANILAHYAGPNPERVDRLFRASALLKSPDRLAKWDAVHDGNGRTTYGQKTIEKALYGHKGPFYIDWLVQYRLQKSGAGSDDGMAESKKEPDPREPIKLDDSELVQIAMAIQAGLNKDPVFQHAGFLCRIRKLEAPISQKNGVKLDAGSIITENLTPSSVILEASKRFRFYRWSASRETWYPCGLPKTYAQAVLDLGEWPEVRVLDGVVRSPVVDLSGNVHMKEGYDKTTGLFHHLDAQVRALPKMDEKEALATVFELLQDFPFADSQLNTPCEFADGIRLDYTPGLDLSVALAFLLTIPIRPFLPTCPLFGFTASMMGTGKTTLATLGGLLGQGHGPLTIGYKKDEEAFTKELVSAFLTLPSFVNIDNVTRGVPVNNSAFNILLSEGQMTARLLGTNTTATLNAMPLITATGNALTLCEDMIRRSLLCRLSVNTEHPEERAFKHENFTPWVLENRARFLAALTTILRQFLSHPKAERDQMMMLKIGKRVKPLGSYLDWSDSVRSCVIALGLPDPVESQRRIEDEDPERQRIAGLFAAWENSFGTGYTLTVEQIRNSEHLKDALMELLNAKRDEDLTPRRIGNWLKDNQRRSVNGLRIVACGQDKHTRKTYWAIEKIEN